MGWYSTRPGVGVSAPLSPEVVEEVMEALRRDFYISRHHEPDIELPRIWSVHTPVEPRYRMPALGALYRRGRRIPQIWEQQEWLFYNKATVFYWTQSAIESLGTRRLGPVILGGIWNAWCDALGRQPHIPLHEFFAVPVSVGEEYARTVPGIVRAHEGICAQLREPLAENIRIDPYAGWWRPDPRYFKLLPIFEALIVVFDEFKWPDPAKPGALLVERHSDGFYHYDEVAQRQSVILARTGHENGLSAPISFESLKDKALPLARREKMGTIDVIRVPLQVGVRFVAKLLLREEAAFPESAMAGPHISKEPDHPFMVLERQAREEAERVLARELAVGQVEPFASAAAVKKALKIPLKRIDRYEAELSEHFFDCLWI